MKDRSRLLLKYIVTNKPPSLHRIFFDNDEPATALREYIDKFVKTYPNKKISKLLAAVSEYLFEFEVSSIINAAALCLNGILSPKALLNICDVTKQLLIDDIEQYVQAEDNIDILEHYIDSIAPKLITDILSYYPVAAFKQHFPITKANKLDMLLTIVVSELSTFPEYNRYSMVISTEPESEFMLQNALRGLLTLDIALDMGCASDVDRLSMFGTVHTQLMLLTANPPAEGYNSAPSDILGSSGSSSDAVSIM